MDDEEKQYGRRRIKKARPLLEDQSAAKPDNPGENIKEEMPKRASASKEESGATGESPRESAAAEKRPVRRSSSERRDKRDSREGSGAPRRESRGSRDRYDKKREKPVDRRKPSSARSGSTARSRTRVSVIIPAYNEEENIRPLAEMFDGVVAREGKDWEVILVNDGSTDKTLDRCKESAARYGWFRYVTYPNNRGLTAALNTGFKTARGSILVFYPADLQYHAQDIPRMLAKFNDGVDLVAGWKQGKYSKRFVSYVYNRLCRWLFNLKVHDMNSVKAFKREVARTLSWRHDWHRYMVVMAAEEGYAIDEVKVKLYPRHRGKSKFGFGRILGGILDLFSVKFQITFMKKPLRFFGTWGIIFGGAGFVIGAIAFYLRFFTTHGSRTLLFPTMLLVLAGLMLFAIGFLAEVLVGLKEEIESLKSR